MSADPVDADPASPAPSPRRRGRRPAGEDTRGAILAAARAEFAAHGYDGTTMRGVARSAGVDPRLVHHYFAGKEELFVAALEIPARPQDILPLVVDPGADGVGERLVRFFFELWDAPEGRERLRAVIASVAVSPEAARLIREFLTREVFGRITARLGADRPDLRASLVASQMLGVAVTRYVVRIEPLASAAPETLVALVGPTVQRYLAGELPGAPAGEPPGEPPGELGG